MDEQFEYRTGRTQPEKSSRGLIAILLICVIFLGGLVSALSFMNIHLFRTLKSTQESAPLSFSRGEASPAAADSLLWQGMALQEPDPVYEQLHHLPEGLFVARVEPGSQAEKLGIIPGDMVLFVGETPISSRADWENALENHKNAGTLALTVCREEQHIHLTFTDFN